MTETVKITWACPKCEAQAGGHGQGRCGSDSDPCDGFICQCDYDDIPRPTSMTEASDHGNNFTNICHNATCDHCGWEGSFPVKPKGLQAWEKKALEAGWVPPEKRKKELGL